MCSEEVSDCRPLCLAANTAWLPQRPPSLGQLSSWGEGRGGTEVPGLVPRWCPLLPCRHTALPWSWLPSVAQAWPQAVL